MRKSITASKAAQTKKPDEGLLIQKAQKNPVFFQEIYTAWVAPVFQYIYARTGSRQDAEDLTSQIFLKAYQALPRYHHRGHFSAWLFTIARNQVNEFFRKKMAVEISLDLADPAAPNPDMLNTVIHTDEIERLKQLIQGLPDEEQELVHLRYVAELKFGDIALVLNRKEAAVKKTLYRLQARLQGLLEAYHE